MGAQVAAIEDTTSEWVTKTDNIGIPFADLNLCRGIGRAKAHFAGLHNPLARYHNLEMFWGNGINFDPDQDIGDLSGKVIVVTGANDGLGKEMVKHLAKHNPDCIFLGSRSVDKGNAAIQEIKVQVPDANIKLLKLDLASLKSVAAAASECKSQSARLDILINNGGIANVPPATTKDGFEIQFGTNYIGHFLLTKLLLPTMLKTAAESGVPGSVRIVDLSSDGHYHAQAPGINFEDLNYGSSWNRYAQSKLANLLHAKALAKRYPTITSTSVHPGTVRTRIFEKMNNTFVNIMSAVIGWAMFTSIDEGVKSPLWAATASDGVVSGSYYTPVGVETAGSVYAKEEELAEQLWQWTEKELSKRGY